MAFANKFMGCPVLLQFFSLPSERSTVGYPNTQIKGYQVKER